MCTVISLCGGAESSCNKHERDECVPNMRTHTYMAFLGQNRSIHVEKGTFPEPRLDGVVVLVVCTTSVHRCMRAAPKKATHHATALPWHHRLGAHFLGLQCPLYHYCDYFSHSKAEHVEKKTPFYRSLARTSKNSRVPDVDVMRGRRCTYIMPFLIPNHTLAFPCMSLNLGIPKHVSIDMFVVYAMERCMQYVAEVGRASKDQL